MDVLMLSEARRRFNALLESVVEDHAPIIIAQPKGRSAVVVSLEDWERLNARISGTAAHDPSRLP